MIKQNRKRLFIIILLMLINNLCFISTFFSQNTIPKQDIFIPNNINGLVFWVAADTGVVINDNKVWHNLRLNI